MRSWCQVCSLPYAIWLFSVLASFLNGLLLSLLPERGGPLPAPSFASSEEGRCLASSDGYGWGETTVGLQDGGSSASPWGSAACQAGDLCTLVWWRRAKGCHHHLVLQPQHRSGFGHFITGMSWPLVASEGQRLFPPNHTSPSLCISLSKRHRQDALIPCHSLKGTGCADTWAETTGTVFVYSFLPPGSDCRAGRNTKLPVGMWPCVRSGGDRGISGNHVHLQGLTASQVSQDLTADTDKPNPKAVRAH